MGLVGAKLIVGPLEHRVLGHVVGVFLGGDFQDGGEYLVVLVDQRSQELVCDLEGY